MTSVTGSAERVAAYIDGFNLYFGVRQHGRRYLWLDLEQLVQSLLRPRQQLVAVRYFTARVRNDPPSGAATANIPQCAEVSEHGEHLFDESRPGGAGVVQGGHTGFGLQPGQLPCGPAGQHRGERVCPISCTRSRSMAVNGAKGSPSIPSGMQPSVSTRAPVRRARTVYSSASLDFPTPASLPSIVRHSSRPGLFRDARGDHHGPMRRCGQRARGARGWPHRCR